MIPIIEEEPFYIKLDSKNLRYEDKMCCGWMKIIRFMEKIEKVL